MKYKFYNKDNGAVFYPYRTGNLYPYIRPTDGMVIEVHEGKLREELIEVECPHLVPLKSTGLKDKNEKEIYEGDIVKYTFLSFKPIPEILVLSVIFHQGLFALGTVNDEPLILREAIKASMYANGLEVIGNVYENPELLKEKE